MIGKDVKKDNQGSKPERRRKRKRKSPFGPDLDALRKPLNLNLDSSAEELKVDPVEAQLAMESTKSESVVEIEAEKQVLKKEAEKASERVENELELVRELERKIARLEQENLSLIQQTANLDAENKRLQEESKKRQGDSVKSVSHEGLLEVIKASIEYSNEQNDSTNRLLLFLLAGDCPITDAEYKQIDLLDKKYNLSMDRQRFSYARLALKQTGAFDEAVPAFVGEGEQPKASGRPRKGYLFDKAKFLEYMMNRAVNK